MSTISSKVVINCIEDGTSIHGYLGVTGAPLAQAYNGSTCLPDWTYNYDTHQGKDHPIIYLSLLKEDVQVGDLIQGSNMNWTFNGYPIEFEVSGKSKEIEAEGIAAGTFVRSTYSLPVEGGGHVTVPSLEICKNIAGPNNQDNDVLTCTFNYREGDARIPIELTASIRIGTVTSNGYFGVLWPAKAVYTENTTGAVNVKGLNYKIYKGGDFALEDDELTGNGVVALYAVIYTSSGEMPFRPTPADYNYVTNFHIGPEEVTEYPYTGDQHPYYEFRVYEDENDTVGTLYPGLILTDADIVDYAVIECDYYESWDATNHFENLLCSAHAEVDDINDAEMMYISSKHSKTGSQTSETGEGNAVFLRQGEEVEYTYWVGKKNDSNMSHRNKDFTYFYIKFLDTLEQEYLGDLSALGAPLNDDDPEAANYGYRVSYKNITNHYGECTVTYSDVKAMGTKVTGFIAACTAPLPDDPINA